MNQQDLLEKEIDALERAKKMLGLAFERELSARRFNIGRATTIIRCQELITGEIVKYREHKSRNLPYVFQEFSVFECSLYQLLEALDISRRP